MSVMLDTPQLQTFAPESLQPSMLRDSIMRTTAGSYSQSSPRSSRSSSIDLRSLPLAPRLSCIPAALAARFEPSTLALVQVWTCSSSWMQVAKAQPNAIVMRTQPMGAHMSDPKLAPFRSSCLTGILRSSVGMLGKVWSSGCLAVVQNLTIIPTSVHPRSKLPDELLERISELAYIPVYDLRNPAAGVVACLEVMMSSLVCQELFANVISQTCDLLTQFQLSLSKPPEVPPLPAALPTPFQNVPLLPGSDGCGPYGWAASSPVASPAAASAQAATALCAPRPTPQQQCYAALLEQELARQRQQGGYCGQPSSGVANYMSNPEPYVFPTRQQAASVGSGSRGSTCSSQSGFIPSGASSPRSPVPAARASLSMSRAVSVRRLDSLADIMT